MKLFIIQNIILLTLFLVTGYPVLPSLKGRKFNYYNDKNKLYFTWLVIHYLLASNTVSFFILTGLSIIFKKYNQERIYVYIYSYSSILAGVFSLIGLKLLMPKKGDI